MKRNFIWLGISIGIVLFVFFVLLAGKPELNEISISNSELARSIESPNGIFTLQIFYHSGVLFYSDYSFIGHIVSEDPSFPERNIFFVGEDNHFHVSWLDDSTLLLRAHGQEVKLDIYTDKFDFRYDTY